MHSNKDLIQGLEDFEDSPEGWGYDLRLSLADIILKHLKDRGWTQKDLAEKAGMKEPFISRLIHGDANCQLDTVGRVLFALQVKADLVEPDRIVGNSAFETVGHINTSWGASLLNVGIVETGHSDDAQTDLYYIGELSDDGTKEKALESTTEESQWELSSAKTS